MSDSSYPTMTHRHLHSDLQLCLFKARKLLEEDTSNPFVRSIEYTLANALERYEEILSSPTTKTEDTQ